MKFKDIKVGDIIYCMEKVIIRRGFSTSKDEQFSIARTVERVTATQFIAGGVRFSKELGRPHGSSSRDYAKRLGESKHYSVNGPFIEKDETAERDAYRKHLERTDAACDYLEHKAANRVFKLDEARQVKAVGLLEAFGKVLDG